MDDHRPDDSHSTDSKIASKTDINQPQQLFHRATTSTLSGQETATQPQAAPAMSTISDPQDAPSLPSASRNESQEPRATSVPSKTEFLSPTPSPTPSPRSRLRRAPGKPVPMSELLSPSPPPQSLPPSKPQEALAKLQPKKRALQPTRGESDPDEDDGRQHTTQPLSSDHSSTRGAAIEGEPAKRARLMGSRPSEEWRTHFPRAETRANAALAPLPSAILSIQHYQPGQAPGSSASIATTDIVATQSLVANSNFTVLRIFNYQAPQTVEVDRIKWNKLYKDSRQGLPPPLDRILREERTALWPPSNPQMLDGGGCIYKYDRDSYDFLYSQNNFGTFQDFVSFYFFPLWKQRDPVVYVKDKGYTQWRLFFEWLIRLSLDFHPFTAVTAHEYSTLVENYWAALSPLVRRHIEKLAVYLRDGESTDINKIPIRVHVQYDKNYRGPHWDEVFRRCYEDLSDDNLKVGWLERVGLSQSILTWGPGVDESTCPFGQIAALIKAKWDTDGFIRQYKTRILQAMMSVRMLDQIHTRQQVTFSALESRYNPFPAGCFATKKQFVAEREVWLQSIGMFRFPYKFYNVTSQNIEVTELHCLYMSTEERCEHIERIEKVCSLANPDFVSWDRLYGLLFRTYQDPMHAGTSKFDNWRLAWLRHIGMHHDTSPIDRASLLEKWSNMNIQEKQKVLFAAVEDRMVYVAWCRCIKIGTVYEGRQPIIDEQLLTFD
ncbi:hypothetical protein GLAREA_07990 [Glarea lozoyensis ATCC 20868]|uniref:Uncharacterized protein n=1 Tax=Glarea lozoyensis (strain ATCC 20868 / MF5171) TaxID=1116229 RepID=S3CDQ0_GLAL2|nr:uncharacterized protein GLAREA_07990 [Glarea lozoyensis ATCC 20868]EPE24140.1 hypothetical protein GLAREA_07990 [Glarea lozoyensis ATCC 20868]